MARAPIPILKTNDIIAELFDYITNPFKIIDKGSSEWLKISKDVKAIKKRSFIEGYLLQAVLHALNNDEQSMEDCIRIVKNNGGHDSLFFFQIGCYFYNGSFYKILNELKVAKLNLLKISRSYLTSYTLYLTHFGLNKTLASLSSKLKKLNIDINDVAQNSSNLNQVLEHFNEDIHSPILAEVSTYLFKNRIDFSTYLYEYDEEQQAIFIEYFVIFYNENGDEIELSEKDFIDFDIKFQKHWINYAAQKNLDTDNLILSLTPFRYLSDSEISELRGKL